jgi:exodeoxyribonuclease VII small subunit
MAGNERKFEDDIKELEAIVARIDSGELSLEESIAAFERGVALIRSLNGKLDEAERKVELLLRDGQGVLQSVPYGDEPRTKTAGDDGDDVPF